MPNYSPFDTGVTLPKRPHHLDRIEDNSDGVIRLFISAEDGTKIQITCDSHLLYMWRDESDALRTADPVTKYGSLIYAIDKSPLMSWFLAEGDNIRQQKDLKHFFIMCANDAIDLITIEDDPIVEVFRGV